MPPRTTELAFARFQKCRDPRALAVVFDRTAPELLRMARHLAGSEADAEDLVQGAFLAAIEAAASHERGRPVLPWLFGILANRARSARRSRRRREREEGARPETVADVHAEVLERELRTELLGAIGRMPEVYRPVLRLWFEHGLQAHEIARTLERPAGTVRAQVSRGIEMLRRALPRGLAGGAAAAAAAGGRGLAAVRSAVLADLPPVGAGIGSALVFGGLFAMQHKVTVLGAALVVGGLGLCLWPGAPAWTAEGPVAHLEAVEGAPPAGALAVQSEAAPARTELPPAAEAVLVGGREADGGLLVRLRGADDRAPLRGFGVAVRSLRETGWTSPVRYRDTDARGEVRFADLEAGLWGVEVDRAGRVGVTEVVAGRPGDAVFVFDVPVGVRVRGEVVDAAGRPVPGARVFLHGIGAGAHPVATCDGRGRFGLERCGTGAALQARHPGRVPSPVRAVPGTGPEQTVRLVLGGQGRRIDGLARGPGGGPVARSLVAILPADAPPVTSWDRAQEQVLALWLETGEDGRFASDEIGIGPQIVFVQPSLPGLAPAVAEADTTAGDAWVELQCATGATVRGTVRGADGPLAGVDVIAWPQRTALEAGYLLNLVGLRHASTDAQGAFALAGLLPGSHSLRALRGEALLGETAVELEGGREMVWDLEALGRAPLRMAVVLPAGSGAAGQLQPVAIVRRARAPDAGPGLVRFGPDLRGAYEGPREGDLDVTLAVLSGGTGFVHLARATVPRGQREVVFELAEGDLPRRWIRGRLVDREGAPLADRTMRVRRAAGGFVHLQDTTAADGSFAVGPLPPGRYGLSVGEGGPVTEVLVTLDRDEELGSVSAGDR